jgi:hypothetical protein
VIKLSSRWAKKLSSTPETGMGYQIVSITLNDGKRYDRVIVIEGQITEIRGLKNIPFTEDQIAEIVLTHDKWNFNAER